MWLHCSPNRVFANFSNGSSLQFSLCDSIANTSASNESVGPNCWSDELNCYASKLLLTVCMLSRPEPIKIRNAINNIFIAENKMSLFVQFLPTSDHSDINAWGCPKFLLCFSSGIFESGDCNISRWIPSTFCTKEKINELKTIEFTYFWREPMWWRILKIDQTTTRFIRWRDIQSGFAYSMKGQRPVCIYSFSYFIGFCRHES